jgi:methyl-accepting chemotaxis protein
MSASLPSGRVFQRRVIGLSFAFSIPALAIVVCGLFATLDLTPEQWSWFLWAGGVYGVLITPLQGMLHVRLLAPLPEYLDRRRLDDVAPELRRAAFASVIDLPRRSALMGCAGWLVPGVVLSVLMSLRWEQWSVFDGTVLLASALAAGFVAGSTLMLFVKWRVAPVRTALAIEIPDPDDRSALVRSTPLRTKLLVSIGGITVVPMIFAVLLGHAQANRSLEDFAIRWQHELLEGIVSRPDRGGVASAARAPGLVDVAMIDLQGESSTQHVALEEHVLTRLRGQLAHGALRGDSSQLPSRHVFAWRRHDERRILLASLPADALHAGSNSLWTSFGLLLLVSMGVGCGLAYLLATDLGRAVAHLRSEAQRLASGDVRPGEPFESEDELGELSRSFESMMHSLRATLGRVTRAADGIESTAAEMTAVSRSLSSATADQVAAIGRTTSSMEAINRQVGGIADSAQALNVSVEESSSSILELGAAGEELNDTASVLSAKVGEVSTSIEQMIGSVKRVLESAGTLAEASIETSASMEEMASSLREVDASAEETARLSSEVIESAETGQVKMVQTIDGMEAIREATETAERVIRSLGGRTSEIGAIVDVIDDVADETNLLALNAAIIAAQAGEHGRAFTVVADEIKDLADRVLASTKEIGGLIGAVQEESSNAIGAIERGTRSVASGVDLTAEAGVSLEEITRASRDSGTRIAGIVAAVREQAKAAVHVVELMERVREGVDQIQAAAAEQDRGNDVIYRSSLAMRDVTKQVRGTTEEQSRGSARIRGSVEGVREAVERINGALQEQSTACRSAVEFLGDVHERTRVNEDSVERLEQMTVSLIDQSETLREDVRKFRIV